MPVFGPKRDWKHLEVPADGRCQWRRIVPRSLVDFPLPLVGPPDNRRVRIGEEEQGWQVEELSNDELDSLEGLLGSAPGLS